MTFPRKRDGSHATFPRERREIAFVKLGDVQIDVAGDASLVIGIQSAPVRIEGRDIDDRRSFVDWFVKESGG
jgi:hypothetical protein